MASGQKLKDWWCIFSLLIQKRKAYGMLDFKKQFSAMKTGN